MRREEGEGKKREGVEEEGGERRVDEEKYLIRFVAFASRRVSS